MLILGPAQAPSWREEIFSSFIDDFTCMVWVYFLEHKSEAIFFFLQFKAQAEKQGEHYLKILRIDVHLFNCFSKKHNIKRELMVR